MTATALIGAQWGSEGKGSVAHHLANSYGMHVRVGGPNAGHTIIHEGRKWAMQAIPCGWVNPDAILIIGAGALIDLEVLVDEITRIEAAGYEIRSRLVIDEKAGIIDPVRHAEGGVHGYAHEIIGSTGKGVGRARLARVARKTMNPMAGAWVSFNQAGSPDMLTEFEGLGLQVGDTVRLLNEYAEDNTLTTENLAYHSIDFGILLEGTQGSGLDLIHGDWPYVTSGGTNAAQLLADTGLSPRWLRNTILVARAHPIRVAGKSGPLPNETTWEDVGQEPELTTVTKKVRRVANWDDDQVERAIMMNRGCVLAFMFLDYLFPACFGKTDWRDLPREAQNHIEALEERLNIKVSYIGTSPNTVIST